MAAEASNENVKESKLDKLRLEVEQMRELVNKFRMDDPPKVLIEREI